MSEVEVRFEDFGEFVTEYSKNLSLTGMFLQTVRPHPPGSSLEFEFAVSGGMRLIRGVGEVVWARAPARSKKKSGDGPPGMGVRFISLDSHSRKLIRWLVDQSLARGQEAFEL